jgi:hypothetical protein
MYRENSVHEIRVGLESEGPKAEALWPLDVPSSTLPAKTLLALLDWIELMLGTSSRYFKFFNQMAPSLGGPTHLITPLVDSKL